MGVLKIKSTGLYRGRLLEENSTFLLESVRASMNSAREQVGRSFRIVAQSRELVDRTRRSIARANHIRQGLTSPTYNPVIVVIAPDQSDEQVFTAKRQGESNS